MKFKNCYAVLGVPRDANLEQNQFAMALVLGYHNCILAIERQIQSLLAKTPAHGDEAHRDVF
jgi:hypothetical protein